jgi:hypothetical protein
MATVYIETSIIGYLTARSASNVVFQARQLLTRQWWNGRRKSYDLLISQLVIDEVSAGDQAAAQERLEFLNGIPLLDAFQAEVNTLSDLLVDRHLLPRKAQADAQHVAVATVFGVDYLLTWNCKHIANAERLPRIYATLRETGYEPPLIVTPEEFSNYE